jgi:peptidyl-prolyl cis-trans isomerase C
MKTVSVITVLALGGALVSGLDAADNKPAAAAPSAGPAGAAATVNGKVITRQQLDEAYQRQVRAFTAQGRQMAPDEMTGFLRQVLGQLIQQELLAQAASKTTVPDLEKKTEEQIAALRAQFPNTEAFQAQIAKAGRTMDDLTTDVQQALRLQEFVEQKFGSKVTVTDEQIKSFYDENPGYFEKAESVRASHILVRVPETAADAEKKEKRAVIDKARERVTKGGEDFAKVAGEVSECPSRQRGGDLDFFGRGQMVPEFEKAAFALKPGEVSDVVTTQFGYHIIQKTGEQAAGKQTLEKSKAMIARFLKDRETRKMISRFLDEQQKAAKVETFVN